MALNNHSSKIRVLVVDDSRVVRVAASRMFTDEFDVLLAVDGADALNIIERDPDIHVVFTDLAMPEMDGFELLEAVRSHTDENIRSLPVIVATGAGNPENAKQKAFSLGATDFITKPFHATDMKARARSYAQFREANRALKEQATIDGLTGALNGKGFHMQLDKELSFVARHEANITVMCMEVDNYKDLFVRIGREGTEAVINRVAKVLADTFRKEDSIARIGLARFAISMPLSHAESALEMANRICHTVESLKARLDGKRIKITVSIGVSAIEPTSDADVDTIIGLANASLEKAAAAGASQLYNMTLDEYREQLDQEARKSMSIDALLDWIAAGEEVRVAAKIEPALTRLAPFFGLLSNEQTQKILTLRQQQTSNVVKFDKGRAS